MKSVGIATVVLLGSLAMAQDIKHAPTVEQCRADQKLWSSGMEQPNSPISFDELSRRQIEINRCMAVDSERYTQYYNTEGEIVARQLLRVENFLTRHKLWDQFHTEDAAGKR